ncbi:MAG TPA: hypothetical protein DCL15_20570 [Chloroflexi bacterium]|nr:hypothetical protein [Chloroflexota bacterium]HHW84935.1 PqqD family protein [Chloroflexota bacterium]
MIQETTRVTWHAQAAARVVDDQALIVLTQRGEVLVLNTSGTWLWNQLEQARTVRDLTSQLATRFHLTEIQASGDVQCFLEHLLEIGAIMEV